MYNKVTIKIGSNVLAGNEGGLNKSRVAELVDEIAALHQAGKQVILVSSGAVASARGIIKVDEKIDPVSRRQLLSSIGQVKLINLYAQLFEKHDIQIAQILVTKEDFRTRDRITSYNVCYTKLLRNQYLCNLNIVLFKKLSV